MQILQRQVVAVLAYIDDIVVVGSFDSIDGTTLGIVKVADAFKNMHEHVGVFFVETRERRGEQAVLAFFANIESSTRRPVDHGTETGLGPDPEA